MPVEKVMHECKRNNIDLIINTCVGEPVPAAADAAALFASRAVLQGAGPAADGFAE